MKRVLSLIVAVLMLIGVASAEMIRTDDSTMFAQGIELLRQINDLRSVEAAEDVFANITSGFNNANYFKMYAQALEDLHNGEYSSALMRLDILEGDNTFAAMLKQYSLPSCESVRVYTEGRQAEEEGRYDDASELYAQANILDSLDRIFELKSRATELTYERAVALFDEGKYAEAADLFMSLGNYMDSAERARQANTLIPTPSPVPTPEPSPTPTSKQILHPGDNIAFGHYEQNEDSSDGAESIEWYVVEVNNGYYTLISKSIVTIHPSLRTGFEKAE